MEEIDLSYQDQRCLLTNEVETLGVGSYNDNFYQCFAEDEYINNEITNALEKIELGKQFAFYNLGISKEGQELLSNIEILGNENKVIRSEECKYFNHCIINAVEKAIEEESIKANAHQANILIKYITRITNNILGESGNGEFELIIRTMSGYLDNHKTNSCEYWHIDKSYGDIIRDNTSKVEKYIGNKVFLVPIIGEKTHYQNINDEERRIFFKEAKEHDFFYGFSSNEECEDKEISKTILAYNDSKICEDGYGSVHKIGKLGTMHAAPNESSKGRIILLITPYNKN
jgi:hypothetical protein